MAERLGQPLMPWQRMVADVGGELDPDTGLPAYREVIVTVPRQSGKTTLVLSWEVQRALGWGSPQRIVYSAQTGNDARKKLIEDQVPILEPHKGPLGIRTILRGMGNEAIEFRNGSRIVLLASSQDSGHGKTVDLAVKDELFADFDNRRDQALIPAMATRAAAQVITTSTAGTDLSVPLNQAITRGRVAVDSGVTEGIAYFEWSGDPASWDPDNPAHWWEVMPALGHTITEPVVRHARDTLPHDEFMRAFGNIASRADVTLIPAAVWDMVNVPLAEAVAPLTFGVDVNPERSAAAISVFGGGVIETIEHRPQVGWLVERCVEIDRNQGSPTWAVDGSKGAPVASFVPALEDAGLRVEPVPAGDLPAACGAMFDAIVERDVTVRRHEALDDAVAAASKRAVGDSFTWARKGTADISPLMAATVARHVGITGGGSQVAVGAMWT